MPRPRKWRKVCCMPENRIFGPIGIDEVQAEYILMSIEEYETIRLIDLQGFTQEESAEHMNIARTTVQRIYNDARKKLAESLVNGDFIKIEGGDYKLCDGLEKSCRCGGCRHHGLNNSSEIDGEGD